MEDTVKAFCHVYVANNNIDICIAELQQRGFNQADLVNALVLVLDYSVSEAVLTMERSSQCKLEQQILQKTGWPPKPSKKC